MIRDIGFLWIASWVLVSGCCTSILDPLPITALACSGQIITLAGWTTSLTPLLCSQACYDITQEVEVKNHSRMKYFIPYRDKENAADDTWLDISSTLLYEPHQVSNRLDWNACFDDDTQHPSLLDSITLPYPTHIPTLKGSRLCKEVPRDIL